MTDPRSPVGDAVADASALRRRRSPAYEQARAEMAPYETLARVVIRHRGEQGLTQQALARKMKTSHTAISRIESGQHPTSLTTIRKLAEAFGFRLLVGFESGPVESPHRELIAV